MTNMLLSNMSTGESKPKQSAKKIRKLSYTDEQMDEALKAVYRSGRQQDGVDLLGINKGTFSRKKREIEEKEPERVERLKVELAAEREVVAQDTLQDTERLIEATKPSQTIQNTSAKEKFENEANTKLERQSFSFRTDIDKIENWKSYAVAIKTKDIGALWTIALDEFMENHPLTAEQQAIFSKQKEILANCR